MTTFVTMQLNADHAAGDWATRSAGRARSSTAAMQTRGDDELAVTLCELRGAVETIRRGAYGPELAVSRTSVVAIGFGSPIMYHGMRFAVSSRS